MRVNRLPADCWQLGLLLPNTTAQTQVNAPRAMEASAPTSAAFVYNDPNSIAEWCLTEALFHIAQSLLHPCQRLSTEMDLSDCRENGVWRLAGLKGPN